jgi:hypothetical protein
VEVVNYELDPPSSLLKAYRSIDFRSIYRQMARHLREEPPVNEIITQASPSALV